MEIVAAPPVARRELCILSDRDVVAAVRAGDERAFEQLYERYHRRIAAYVYGMVGDYGRAEDITQDVFLSALRRIRNTERPIALKPWLYEIAKNACIDQFRRSRRAEEVSYDADGGMGTLEAIRVAPRCAEPDAMVDAKQQLDQLCGAFGGLSDVHHRILVMRELEGLSYREIGDRLGLSRPSVESTLFRARRRLGEEYDDLVSGERCLRVQSIIVTASRGATGVRDRRLLRHVAHCRPCRRQARLAGVDVASVSRRPVRDAVVARVAAFLPLPLLTRARRPQAAELVAAPAAHAPLAAFAEPIAGWVKAVVAASLVVAGAGAGAVAPVAVQPAPERAGAPAPPRAAAVARRAPRSRDSGSVPRRDDRRSGSDRAPGATAGPAPAGPGSGGAPREAAHPVVAVQRLVPALDEAPVPAVVAPPAEQAARVLEPADPASSPAPLPEADLATGVTDVVDAAAALGGG